MSGPTSGRQIFDQLVEYPLAVQTGIRDYICYFVAPPKGYFDGAQAFFGKNYPNHVVLLPPGQQDPKNPVTLQDMMLALQADITASGVTQIRELVIVAHANAGQLFIPVVPPGPDVDAGYGCLTAYSLAALQDDLDKGLGDFLKFDDARKAVVPLLLNDSWVTIRACNIGNSADCMYSLYSFFGGRANVYAPTKTLFFGDCPIGPGRRVETKFGVYDYLVKQHYFATNEHTPGRQATIVTDLVDPEAFSATFNLASAALIGGNPADVASYQALIDGLNAYTVSDALRAAFTAAGHQLSAQASVVRAVKYETVEQQGAWYLTDQTVQSDGQSYDIVYEVRDQTDAQQTATLAANAQIAALVSSNASFPIQLFFSPEQDDAFMGVVAKLATYADGGAGAISQWKDQFTVVQGLLNSGSWSDGTNDLAQAVNAGLDTAQLQPLPDPLPPIQPGSSAGTWTVAGAVPLLIVTETGTTTDGFLSHELIVHEASDPKAQAQAQLAVIARVGRVPDTPGTELPAYLDRFTADELAGLIDYLRSAYQPAYSFYVRHALAAIARKRDFGTWAAAQPDFTSTPLPAHVMLRPNETHNVRAVAFGFDFNDNWQEVKQSSPLIGTFEHDLYGEEDLKQKLHLQGTWLCSTLGPGSRFANRADLRSQELPGFESFLAYTPAKTLMDLRPLPVSDGCLDFRNALEKWQQLRDTGGGTQEQLIQALEALPGSGGNYYQKIQEGLEPFHLTTELSDMFFDTKIEWRVVLVDKLAEEVSTEWLADALEAAGGYLEIASPAFMIPFEMWLQSAEGTEQGVENSNVEGQLVAIRQWLRKLRDLTFKAPFPDQLDIDLGGPDAWNDNYVADEKARHISGLLGYTFSPDDMKAGFVQAADEFGRIGPQIVEQADKFISEQTVAMGLGPCQAKVMTDVGVLDLDTIRRKVIRTFAQAVLDSVSGH